jgi:hypothetical protein
MSKFILPLAFVGILAASPASAQFFEEKFGSERVEIREFRNADVRRAAEARPATHAGHNHAGHEHGIETENLFGFTLGSDTEHKGAKGVAIENIMRFSKRETHYTALGQKLEFAYGIMDSFSASLALLGDYHRIKEKPAFLGTVGDVKARYLFNGFGGEIRYRFLDRKTSPFGLTLHLEPSLAFSDEASGLKGRKYGSENKLIFDQEIVQDKLFVAFNLTQELEVVKERGAGAWERGSVIGASLAATYQVLPNIFLGAETRYLRAYDALRLKTYNGDAWYIGPTFSARFAENYWISVAYSGLVGGHAKGSSQKLDLGNFERHQIRLKAGMEF